MNMQVLGGCIVLMKQKASFVSASFNESRYEIQGFLHTLFLTGGGEGMSKARSPLGGLGACPPRKFWILKSSGMPFPVI